MKTSPDTETRRRREHRKDARRAAHCLLALPSAWARLALGPRVVPSLIDASPWKPFPLLRVPFRVRALPIPPPPPFTLGSPLPPQTLTRSYLFCLSLVLPTAFLPWGAPAVSSSLSPAFCPSICVLSFLYFLCRGREKSLSLPPYFGSWRRRRLLQLLVRNAAALPRVIAPPRELRSLRPLRVRARGALCAPRLPRSFPNSSLIPVLKDSPLATE